MKPVDQTTFGFPDGNCFSACLASLLEIPIEEVPWFMEDDDWYKRANAWLQPRGFYLVFFAISDWHPPGFYILGGESPRGDWDHAVVARGDEIVHDPHPDRTGLVTRKDVTLLIPYDPATARR